MNSLDLNFQLMGLYSVPKSTCFLENLVVGT